MNTIELTQSVQMLKLEGQGVQDAQVDGSHDFRGFGSSCPRCPRCFKGGGGGCRHRTGEFGAGEQESARLARGWLAATNNETLRLTNNEQSRYAISNRIATTASMLQHSAENLRGAGHVPARRDIILFTCQTARTVAMIDDQ